MFTYTKQHNTAYSVFKINKENWTDSLVYEYFVGKTFINKYLNIFPCFIETYNMYTFDDNFKTLINNTENNIKLQALKHITKIQKDFAITQIAKKSCEHGRLNNLGILLQHYDNFTEIDKVDNSNDIYQLLFQVYFCLHVIKNNFTHYDLHSQNALAYKPYIGNRYVEMTYHFNDGTIVKFPTDLIMKIIDYGRCHFNHVVNEKTESTMEIVNSLCADTTNDYTKDPCYVKFANGDEEFCGESIGMLSVFGENVFNKAINSFSRKEGTFHFVNPATANVSHDLRLLSYINKVSNLTLNVKYDTGPGGYGTREEVVVSWNDTTPRSTIIQNVTDAMFCLKQQLTVGFTQAKFVEWSTGTKSPNKRYNKYGASEGWKKMGEFHIYEDQRNYEFIPTPSEASVDDNQIASSTSNVPQAVPATTGRKKPPSSNCVVS